LSTPVRETWRSGERKNRGKCCDGGGKGGGEEKRGEPLLSLLTQMEGRKIREGGGRRSCESISSLLALKKGKRRKALAGERERKKKGEAHMFY